MESPIKQALEKIKLQEHVNEVKLKEKRTYEAKVLSLNREVRDALAHAARQKTEHSEVVARIDALKAQLDVEKARCIALSGVLEKTQNELQTLQEKTKQGISSVWNHRSTLCDSVQNVSDECGVWAMLTKRQRLQLPASKKVARKNIEHAKQSEDRLKHAVERLREMKAERDRLQSEPDTSKEFLRMKNALRYLEAMAANLV